LNRMLIAVVAMFLQQTCGSVGRVLPAVLAPLIIVELNADPAWIGVYFGLSALAALIGQLGSGGFIIRHGAIRMSQVTAVHRRRHGHRNHRRPRRLHIVRRAR
jgi:hypothetical protein